MSLYENLTGQKFNRLTVCEEYYDSDKKIWMAFCICECGNTTDVRKSKLRSGSIKSCGCIVRERMSKLNFKHGEFLNGKMSKEYQAWFNIKARCYNSNNISFPNYGGRGIKVCDRWLDSFENFFEDMGRAPSSRHSIDRINNDSDYCKENCRWATWKEQARNKRNNVYVIMNNEKKTIARAILLLPITRDTLYHYMKRHNCNHQEAIDHYVKKYLRQEIHGKQ